MSTQEMIAELSSAPEFMPSAFWADIAQRNEIMLDESGIASFKRTLSNNYFNWPVTAAYHPYFVMAVLKWLRTPRRSVFSAKIEDQITLRLANVDKPLVLSSVQRQIYKAYVCFVWERMRTFDRLRISDWVEEPLVGAPISIRVGQKLISQDLANSVVEANLILPVVADLPKPRFAEIGAGYGRLAHVVSAAVPSTYCIFDIPPALEVSQWYVQQVLPEKRVFGFRRFGCFADVEDELRASDVAFFTSNQMALFPDRWFDVTSTISTLPEMTARQVNLFLNLMQSKTARAIFFKQWKSWGNRRDGFRLQRSDYVLQNDWRLSVDRTDPLVPSFFNQLWERI
ncbi:MAG TPA: putative sugar O-methyltransferase [Pseudolabrys sp.]|uniref:putative sugar O-methyltransferase n=1 Tax=Pseudolabrys sp. TaxID=1960880 RepID=UPI002DDD5AD8|nr:putative sugar O-methyltransferase [Pseudolabrys sp.]HEV2629197.1 putative sugar O-methyltransferase [Pseudolabrys sp.]